MSAATWGSSAPPISRDLRLSGRVAEDHTRTWHACWMDPEQEPAWAVTALCDRSLTIASTQRGVAAATCPACLAALEQADRAATAVMESGEPGGHASQHDQGCPLACACGTNAPKCRRHALPQDDPELRAAALLWAEARPAARAMGCDRLPGCGWPTDAETADAAGEVGG